jgi:hypothetical protein
VTTILSKADNPESSIVPPVAVEFRKRSGYFIGITRLQIL